jgi:formyltetrahydrofolate deformylase
MANRARVLIDCGDEKGLVFNISKVFFEHNLNIDSNREFVDKERSHFFMRTVVTGEFEPNSIKNDLRKILPRGAKIRVIVPQPKKIVLFATKEPYVVGDILIRYADRELPANIEAVISNRDVLRDLVRRFDIPFIYIPSEHLSREEHEELILKELDYFDFDYIVLAKYMRILTPDFVNRFTGKILNIHHSFLPAFIGANPYRQAYERGVKIIGATAHFVTEELDEGPIIAQDVISINHRFSWKDMQRAGRDVEKVVLSRALDMVLNDRVFINGNKTVLF